MRTIVLIIALVFTAWCSPSMPCAAERPAAQHTAEDERKASEEQSMEERFRRIGRDLDQLNARAATMAKQARKDIDRQLADAEKKRQTAEQKLDALKTEGKKKWDSFARDLNAALDEFEQAYERAKEHFKE